MAKKKTPAPITEPTNTRITVRNAKGHFTARNPPKDKSPIGTEHLTQAEKDAFALQQEMQIP